MLVARHRRANGRTKKLNPRFIGPYQNAKRVSSICYLVEDLQYNRRKRVWRRFKAHSSQLRKYHSYGRMIGCHWVIRPTRKTTKRTCIRRLWVRTIVCPALRNKAYWPPLLRTFPLARLYLAPLRLSQSLPSVLPTPSSLLPTSTRRSFPTSRLALHALLSLAPTVCPAHALIAIFFIINCLLSSLPLSFPYFVCILSFYFFFSATWRICFCPFSVFFFKPCSVSASRRAVTRWCLLFMFRSACACSFFRVQSVCPFSPFPSNFAFVRSCLFLRTGKARRPSVRMGRMLEYWTGRQCWNGRRVETNEREKK